MRGRDKNLGMGNEPARTLHAVLQRRGFSGLISFKLDCNTQYLMLMLKSKLVLMFDLLIILLMLRLMLIV